MTKKLAIGMQIAYIPHHANGDINHRDVEFGFITGYNSHKDPFCRYYHKDRPGVLRTTANSECTPRAMVVPSRTTTQTFVDDFLRVHYPDAVIGEEF